MTSSASVSVRAADTVPSMPRMLRARTAKLGLVGTVAGFFSGLFGIGGGVLLLPPLLPLLRFQEGGAAGGAPGPGTPLAGGPGAGAGGFRHGPRAARRPLGPAPPR